MKNIKIFSTYLLITTCYLLLSPTASAHVLKTDNAIGAVIHIDPEDDPIANIPSTITIELKDKENKFTLDTCKCTFSVSTNNNEIHTEPLTSPSIQYTFPERNVYRLKITGSPTEPDTFKPFTLTYDIRVERQQNTDNEPSQQKGRILPDWLPTHTLHYALAFIMLGVVIYSIITNRKKNNE